ncbi:MULTISPECIES: outer membrane usher protein [Providencia]|uniref:outer membrane usher protein n=1 Tax=Providencia TaxID=586 RepID=UPI001B35A447|nr:MULTISPECIES: outer membrane usher protein [Providencia]UNJ80152.1 Fimbriae usher protein StfC [Providencia sp.]EHZ7765867.1 outer membrane usher protein [Providencia rettgeri]EIJ7169009.1 outer membrane usher protein [Providencia rettgeri]EJD6048613.1 outer membrane usher protein [Providencia rettgeri]EJD6477699.1 outer membrane usher protein [Providencia rettgeri]
MLSFDLRGYAVYLTIITAIIPYSSSLMAADTVQFNTELLDLNDKKNIDLGQFSREGYIMPGHYSLKIQLNQETLPEQTVNFYSSPTEANKSQACVTNKILSQLGLKDNVIKELTWWHEGNCVNLASLPGTEARGDLSTSTLYLNIPQAYLEYRTATWDPPSLWDEGISGILLDYNITARANHPHNKSGNTYNLNGNGVAGVNLGVWRIRSDWQSRLNHVSGLSQSVDKDFQWSRFYAYRAIPQILAKLTLGEDYLNSDLFDSFRFTGGSLRSDLNMLPPNLRGYAPEISGIATTNAVVIVSQEGRVLYQTQVAAGPFRIQDLSDATSGKLNVRVEEQDGTVQEFQVDTATIPYLTRPGAVRYKLSLGKPSTLNHRSSGNMFATGEFSWGISNGWSLFGGSLNSQDYNAFAMGVGRDLLALGAISFDVTQSIARLPEKDRLIGGSYRINYSKRFDDYDSQIQFAGYRFSERDFMSMSDYLNTKESGERLSGSKSMYVISLNKNFRDIGLSTYLNYNHETYWDRPDSNRYNLMLTKTMDFSSIKNVNISLSAYRNEYNNTRDDGAYLSLSLPWSNGANIGYSISANNNETTNRTTYYDRFDSQTSYQLSLGSTRLGGTGSAYVTHQGSNTRLTANANYTHNGYTSFGLGAQGGLTFTPEGADMHRVTTMGGTRLLVDTDGVSDIPVKGRGPVVNSNLFGKAIVPDINSYYRNKIKIDLNRLPDNTEVTDSVVQATLTEGAIGYRKFEVLSGRKMMVAVRLEDGSYPPFGAQIRNNREQDTGIVDDNGQAYISGINPNEIMIVQWGSEDQCKLQFPTQLDTLNTILLLQCKPITPHTNR